MTDAQKLEALVRRAFENKWEGFGHCRGAVLPWYIVSAGQMPTPKVVESWVPKDTLLIAGMDDYYFVWERVLFGRDGIARALFGGSPYRFIECRGQHSKDPTLIRQGGISNSQFHVMFAAIDKDPIDYMYKAVFGK